VLSPETTSQKPFSRTAILAATGAGNKSTLVTEAMTFPDDLRLEEARNAFMSANGFSVSDYQAATFTIGILGLKFTFPNTAGRRRAVPFHDLHHILTGFPTDWVGEAEIGAWELRAGCNTLAAYFLNGGGVIIGLLIAPRRVWRAFRSAKGQRTLYFDPASYDQLLRMTVGEVRGRLGIRRQPEKRASTSDS
jgi:hypothetical protein